MTPKDCYGRRQSGHPPVLAGDERDEFFGRGHREIPAQATAAIRLDADREEREAARWRQGNIPKIFRRQATFWTQVPGALTTADFVNMLTNGLKGKPDSAYPLAYFLAHIETRRSGSSWRPGSALRDRPSSSRKISCSARIRSPCSPPAARR
jgi:hypothetical protein